MVDVMDLKLVVWLAGGLAVCLVVTLVVTLVAL